MALNRRQTEHVTPQQQIRNSTCKFYKRRELKLGKNSKCRHTCQPSTQALLISHLTNFVRKKTKKMPNYFKSQGKPFGVKHNRRAWRARRLSPPMKFRSPPSFLIALSQPAPSHDPHSSGLACSPAVPMAPPPWGSPVAPCGPDGFSSRSPPLSSCVILGFFVFQFLIKEAESDSAHRKSGTRLKDL